MASGRTIDKLHEAREEMENQRERERGINGGSGICFTVWHVVVLLTTGNPLGHAVNVSRHPIRPDVLHFAEEKPFASWIAMRTLQCGA